MKLRIFFSILLFLNIISLLSASELSEDEYRLMNSMSLEELLNTDIATGSPIKQKFAPSVTSILTEDEIRKSGARTLHEVLEQVPGLHIYPSDLDIMSEKVSIRGIQTGFNPQVLFMMDGVPLSDLLNGHPGFAFRMPVSIIHRIEIIRGPGSALYGADAFSGVINIVSKKYDNIVDQVGVRYGSFNTWEAWANQSVEADEVGIGLSVSMMKSDGDDGRFVEEDASSPTPASGSVDTRYDTAFLHADVSYKELDFNLLVERSRDLGVGAGHLRILDSRGFIDRDKILGDLQHTNLDWFDDTVVKTNISFSYLDSQANYNPRNSWQQGKPYAKEYMASVSTCAVYSGVEDHVINLKVGYKYGRLDPSQTKNFGPGIAMTPPGVMTDVTDTDLAYMQEHSRKNIYSLIQDEYSISHDIAFVAGVRFDNYDDFGSTYNPRLALVWQESEDLTLKAMYGRAFRAPTFGELYLENNPAFVGNPNLDPETIDTYELALNYRGKVHSRVNIFYYKAKDLIDYVQDTAAPTPSTAQNAKSQTGYGLELEFEYALNDSVSLRANYAYQHSEDDNTKERIANAPVHQAFAQLQYMPSTNWNINTQYFYIGKRYRESSDTRGDLGSDSLVNLTIERTNIFKGLDALLSARNLFDTDVREPSSSSVPNDYPMQGIYLFAELRYRF